MKKEQTVEEEKKPTGLTRRNFCKAAAGIPLVFAVSSIGGRLTAAEDDPPEPESLDVPTEWQEGDPEPVEMAVPAQEPEQTSNEAPPCQPMEDEETEQPSDDHVWVSGYWWWNNSAYLWVPGYWSLPPRANLAYLAGHWVYKGNRWVYVRGGWATVGTTAIVAYAAARPLLRIRVFPAPRRIVRRHRRWGYYASRRVRRRVDRRVNRRVDRRKTRRTKRRNR